MCLGKPYQPGHKQKVYELSGFKRTGYYAIFQILLLIIGFAIIGIGGNLFGTDFIMNVIIGAIIIVIFSILPNGKPFFFNLYKMGRQYIIFDGNNREVLYIKTHLSGSLCKPSQKVVCSYSQFRGIAFHEEKRSMLLLCKREESLLIPNIGECLPDNKSSIKEILEEISLYWFSHHEQAAFFGVTSADFENGVIDENDVKCDIEYDFYLKKSQTWRPKHDVLGNANVVKKNDRVIDAKSPENDFDIEQYLDPKRESKNNKHYNPQDRQGAEIDVGSDDEIVRDYV